MSTSVTNVVSHFPSAENGFTTTLASTISSGAITVPLNSVAGYTNGETVVFVVDPADATKKQTFTGIIDTAGVQVTNVVWTAGTNQTHAGGATVVDYVTATHISMVSKGILEEHKPTGAHSDITADSITVLGDVEAASFTLTGAGGDNGWSTGLPAPDTVTYNGNRSYDLVFNGTDLTDTVSNGMRLRATRTVTPPTQCTDLEASSSQYWSKTSPAGLSFTTTFTCAGWVKLESYVESGIIARMNGITEGWSFYITATGQVRLHGRRIAGNHKLIESYQSIPLNKWVHVAACIDMTAADTTAQKIWVDGVEVPRAYTLTGTATALVQGTTALVVGAAVSAGTSPMDGKIAQASVHSACLSDAQIKAMASQTISSSTPSIVSGFTFNGAATDVSANANDLTASGGAGYTTDSPFNATEYGIITANSFSTDTTLTVQVPEGYAIPTSGGVSAVAYSTQSVPYGFPRDEGKWAVEMRSGDGTTSLTSAAWTNTGSFKVIAPIGAWEPTYAVSVQGFRAGGTGVAVSAVLSESTSAVTAGYEDSFSSIGSGAAAASQPFSVTSTLAGSTHKSYTSATAIYWLQNGTLTSGNLSFASGTGGSQVQHSLKLLFAYL